MASTEGKMWAYSPAYQLLVLASFGIILFLEKDGRRRLFFGWYSVLVFLFLFNPLSYMIAGLFHPDIPVYIVRLFLLVPIFAVVSYALVILVKNANARIRPVFLLVGILVIMFFGYPAPVEMTNFGVAENPENVPGDLIEVSNIIKEDWGDGYKGVMIPVDERIFQLYIRQIDPSIICVGYPKLDEESESYYEDFMGAIRSMDVDYWIYEKTDDSEKEFHKLGAVKIGKTKNFDVYKDDWHSPKRTYDDVYGKVTSKFYYDADGNLLAQNGGVTGTEWTYDTEGRIATVRYYGEDGRLFCIADGYAGIDYGYDEDSRENQRIYIGTDGNPKQMSDGSFGYRITGFNENSQVLGYRYLDEDEQPTTLKKGYAGIDYVYDEENRLIKQTFLNEKDEPVVIADGYASFEQTYDENGWLMSVTYFDADGSSILLPGGYATVKYVGYDENGVSYGERYFDTKGDPVMLPAGYAGVDYERDENNRVTKYTYLDQKERPTEVLSGYTCLNYIYDNLGNVTSEYYEDGNGNRVALSSGRGGYERIFDGKSRVTKYTYIDEEQEPFEISAGYATIRYLYDENGYNTGERYYDGEDHLCKNTSGYAGVDYVRDEAGYITRYIYLDEEEQPTEISGGYAMLERTYDIFGYPVDDIYLDKDGKKVELSGGYTSIKRYYNEFHQVMQIDYLDADDKLTEISDGYASLCYMGYDAYGYSVGEMYLDTNGKPTAISNDFYGVMYTRDERMRLVETTYVDQDKKPMEKEDGVAYADRSYERNGQIQTEVYLDTKRNPVEISTEISQDDGKTMEEISCYSVRYYYDSDSCVMKTEYLDRDGQPVYTNER